MAYNSSSLQKNLHNKTRLAACTRLLSDEGGIISVASFVSRGLLKVQNKQNLESVGSGSWWAKLHSDFKSAEEVLAPSNLTHAWQSAQQGAVCTAELQIYSLAISSSVILKISLFHLVASNCNFDKQPRIC